MSSKKRNNEPDFKDSHYHSEEKHSDSDHTYKGGKLNSNRPNSKCKENSEC